MKICSVNLRPMKVIVAVFLVGIMLFGLFTITKTQSVYFGYTARSVPIYCVETSEKKVALSFDAAWGSDKTNQIIEICKANNIEVTFFLVGFWVDANPDKVKAIYDAGFDIGTHSETHPQMSKLSAVQMENELTTSCGKISAITGQKVRFFRPPYGDYNNLLLQTASNLGLQTIQWSVDTLDWKGLSASQILTRVEQGLDDGAIILCHNNSDHIVEALPELIGMIKSKGYSLVKMSNLVYENSYTIDNNGVQHKN
ncbi:MAG: polysaccharide deacetylase family protein [Clostridia bacterium]|nr:polysaccharide deacetylase family protein [Clostridia bacterium]